MELNVRIQKSLILDFDLASAKQSALEDWKIDIERELMDGPIPDKAGEDASHVGRTKAKNNAFKNRELEGIKENDDEDGFN